MRITRIFIDTALNCGEPVVLSQQASRHAGTVMRLRPGDALEVFNGSGGSFRAVVAGRDRGGLIIEPREFLEDERESPLALQLVQGISRGQHMDYTLQKSVELGVAGIVPVMTEFGNVRLHPEKVQTRMAHWRGVIISACEQCGRNRLPDLKPPLPLAEWLSQDRADTRCLLEPAHDAVGFGDIGDRPRRLSLLVGPEGGLSRDETDAARQAGYRSIHLGPRVLRTETAAVAAVAVCQTLWGDLS